MPETSKRRLHDEVIEDSEPEREAKRKKMREQARLARKKKCSSFKLQQADRDVIELTDTECNSHGPISATVGAQSQVDKPISATSRSPLTKLPSSPQLERTESLLADMPRHLLAANIAPDRRGHRSNVPDTTSINRTSTYPTPPPIATLEALLSSDSDDESHLKLSRFAFQAPVSNTEVNKPRGLSCSGSTVAAQTLPESSSAPKAKLKRPNAHHFSNDFSDTQLTSLTNCVSCNLKWTSKKTTSQKMIHIQNCAKKKFLSDETVKTLIGKEIGSSSNQNSREGTGQKTAEEGENSTTFLETVVNEDTRTKKGRRPHVLGTVKSLPETRGSILGKARAVLDASMQHRDSVVRAPVSNQNLGGTHEVPCTQAFGTSMLARREDRDQVGPPQTQDFGESALGHLQSNFGLVALHARTSGL
ncbi:hypothetical protein K503DRAFT_795367 [Rhizopogon vinicolor AM-OR11-026]|uniref:Uncharacterized protein n=1 Tax=Rhizopogon vinicolor AM-OR11-026 TaxID=1314800 RepID=A0A1B7NIC9_9AGAM|nr:hypothetical protein K503DRAFT_795367 [Rhizopogon vinicolor AM-OR11-026]